MFKKQQQEEQKKVNESEFKRITPVLSEIDFEWPKFKEVNSVKKWFVDNAESIGYLPDFNEKGVLNCIPDKAWCVVMHKSYGKSVKDVFVEWDEGVNLYYEFYLFKVKDSKTIDDLQAKLEKLNL